MKIKYSRENKLIKVVIDGNIDSEGGDILTTTLNEISAIPDLTNIVFDLTTVITTTSSGIGKLLRFFKHVDSIGGKMEVKGISDNLYSQFKEIHLDRIFPINK